MIPQIGDLLLMDGYNGDHIPRKCIVSYAWIAKNGEACLSVRRFKDTDFEVQPRCYHLFSCENLMVIR